MIERRMAATIGLDLFDRLTLANIRIEVHGVNRYRVRCDGEIVAAWLTQREAVETAAQMLDALLHQEDQDDDEAV